MHVVLTLPDSFEERLKENKISSIMNLQIQQSLKDAIILPKDHGRLIDANKLYIPLYYDEILLAPTVLNKEGNSNV